MNKKYFIILLLLLIIILMIYWNHKNTIIENCAIFKKGSGKKCSDGCDCTSTVCGSNKKCL